MNWGYAELHFNSSLVRLRGIIKKLHSTHTHNFNSSLVRLRDYQDFKGLVKYFLFQFQFGTIKRASALGNNMLLSEFQFQFGTIKSRYNGTKLKNMKAFQFQFGTIKSVR